MFIKRKTVILPKRFTRHQPSFRPVGRSAIRSLSLKNAGLAPLHFEFRWNAHKKAIRKLFSFIQKSGEAVTLAYEKRQLLESQGYKLHTAAERKRNAAKKMRLDDRIESYEYEEKVFSGSTFILLSDLLSDFASRLGLPTRRIIVGSKINGVGIYQLIWVAGNNFRHYEEWSKNKSRKNVKKNMGILRRAGVPKPFDRNVCPEVFALIGWTKFEDMEAEVIALTKMMMQLHHNRK